jgi:hypothetical protein
VSISASDTVPISTGPTDAVLVATTGTATVIDASGNSTTWTALPAGVVIPVSLSRVNSTGLTAVLLALYY